MTRTYVETFDSGAAGWWGWISNAGGPRPLEHAGGVVTSRSPWWIDYNHAPPGAGYLHMLFCTYTQGPIAEHYAEVGGPNALVAGGFPTDYTNARFTLRLKGELELRGSQLVLLVQAALGGMASAWVLAGQPIPVTGEWTTQTVTAVPDPQQWTCMGARHDRGDYYGRIDLATVLRDVNIDLMFILFPLHPRPMGPIAGDPHLLRPGKDYPVWQSSLPEGYVMLDALEIEFA
ncbi:MAG: hypothetical protein AB1505_12535 [Candidatus Latescibacterota bacterium]